MQDKTTLEVVVKNTGNTYVSARVNGIQASCTSGAKQAAERFGDKYFGPAYIGVVETTAPSRDHWVTTWLVFADDKAYAWCWASGLIQIGDEPPADDPHGAGPIVFASGPKRALEWALGIAARHGKGASKGNLLVPGVPEAKNQQDAVVELSLWVNQCARKNGQTGARGVVFSNLREDL
jgi:hypothetical protein